MSRVINLHREKDPSAVYIGRGSIFGNPYSHQDGTTALYRVVSREAAIEGYRKYLHRKILTDTQFRLELMKLDGKILSCYCHPLPCHGHVIIRAINWLKSLKAIDPFTDGINHINVYSKGNTALGRLLSNFALTPFRLIDHGDFNSVEGYWYWLSTRDDKLRTLYGSDAKKYGREIRGPDWPKDEEFKANIKRALRAKIITFWDKIAVPLMENNLPLKHYYVQGGAVVYPKEGCQWILDYIEEIKRELHENKIHQSK